MWTNAVLGVLLLALASGTHVWWQHQFSESGLIARYPQQLTEKIGEIQDIEHLRKLSLLLVRQHDGFARDVNDTITKGVSAFVAISFSFAIILLVNWLSILKHRREIVGKPVKWLRWL
jgi:hypothetical protein